MKKAIFLLLLINSIFLVSCSLNIDSPKESEQDLEQFIEENVNNSSVEIAKENNMASNEENLDNFANDLIKAINQEDIDFLIENYDSIYGKTTIDEQNSLIEGLEFYKKIFNNEEFVQIQFKNDVLASYDTPNTIGKQYVIKNKSGITKDILIKIYSDDDKKIFKYKDDLLFYGPYINNFIANYIKAIKDENLEFLYNYLSKGDEDAETYNANNNDNNYNKKINDLLKNYKEIFDLKTIDYKITGEISSAYNVLKIEYIISGASKNSEIKNHNITGVFEFPIVGVLDTFKE